jgi:outer membrane protein TolC
MIPTRHDLALFRRLSYALVCTCLIAGCSHDLTQPSIDLLPALPSNQTASDSSGSLPVEGPLAMAIVSNENCVGSAPSPLSLPAAIDFALQNNPRLLAALAAAERAGGQETAAFAPFLPQIDLLNRYVATGKSTVPGAPGPTGAVNPSVIGHYQVYQSELQLQWTLYDFGRTAGRYGQASMREKIARLQAVRARETVAYDVASAYLQALEAAALRRIAAETVRRAQAILEDVRARREGGVALRDDVLRGEVQLSESRDALVRAEDTEITAVAQLNNAMGRDASLPLTPDEGVYPGKFTASLAECLQRAAEQRPEVGVARDRVALAQFGREAAKGEFLPQLTLKGSLGRIEGENVVGGWQEGAGIQLNVPLFHGGANRGNLRAAEADISQASAEAQGVLNDVSLEVTVAHRGVVSAQARVELSRPAVEQSAEALRIVRGRYRSGTATPTDVIEAETASTRAEQRFATARLEYLLALARLAYVMGDDPGGLCVPMTGPCK